MTVLVVVILAALVLIIWRVNSSPMRREPHPPSRAPEQPLPSLQLNEPAEARPTPAPAQPVKQQPAAEEPPPVVGVDVETTGFDAERSRIVQVAAIRLEGVAGQGLMYTERDRLVTLVNPHSRMGATKIHGITQEDVKDSPAFGSLTDKLTELLQDAIIVGHNVDFDLRFLRAAFARAGVEFPRIVGTYCTLKMARGRLDLPDYKLATCCEALSIPYSPHEAEADATAALHLWGKLLER